MRPEPRGHRPTLAAAQSALLAFVTGAPIGDALAPDLLVAGDGRATAGERIAIYAHMYRARLAEALATQFPRLALALGPASFGRLAASYAGDHPSRHPSLRYLGQYLPAWMAANGEGGVVDAGLARLEWARADLFDLADEPTLTTEAARAWPPERLGELPLRLIAAHRIVTVAAGTAARWDAPGGDGAHAAMPAVATESLVVWREGTAIYHRTIDGDEREALALIARGASFGTLCEGLLSRHDEPDAVRIAFAWLSTWLADGLLRAV